MRSFIAKYLGNQVPFEERLFYLAIFMSSVSSLGYVSVALFLQADIINISLYSCISIIGFVLLSLESHIHKTTVLSAVYLSLVNFIIFPLILYFSENITVDAPLYMLIGLTYAIVLLKGKLRIILLVIQLFIDLSVTFYCYVIRNQEALVVHGAVSTGQFVSLELSIIFSGVLCGVIVAYRNNQLHREMVNREEATLQAEKVSFAKDMFLVNISHEIRTPLNAIIGTTDLLLDSNAPNHVKEMAFNISNSSHALLSITSDLLDFSRLNVDSLDCEKKEYDIALMLNDIINLMSVRLLDSNVEFYVNVNPKLPKLLIGDGVKIRQIFINMLSNAIKYTPSGYMVFDVDYEEVDKDTIHLLTKVTDTGIGIKADSIEKIFEPLHRSGEVTDRLIEGNGLGLALCRKLATIMGGKIYAESEFGKGSTFFFEVNQSLRADSQEEIGHIEEKRYLAVYLDNRNDGKTINSICNQMGIEYTWAECDEEFVDFCDKNRFDLFLIDVSAYERVKRALQETAIDWRKMVVISGCNYSYSGEPFECVLTKPISCLNLSDVVNNKKNFAVKKQSINGRLYLKDTNIMIVDDNLVNLSVAAGLFSRYEPKSVITAASGMEAVNAIKEEEVDIVFLDYMMPDMDGIDTLKAIRELEGEKYSKVPVIALTANVVSGAREMFLDAGFDDYLSKPLELELLEKALLEHLPSEMIRFSI